MDKDGDTEESLDLLLVSISQQEVARGGRWVSSEREMMVQGH